MTHMNLNPSEHKVSKSNKVKYKYNNGDTRHKVSTILISNEVNTFPTLNLSILTTIHIQ